MLTLHPDTIVVPNVSFEDYLDTYAENAYEWVGGTAYKTNINIRHYNVNDYLRSLLQAYFSLRPVGQVLGRPFLMILSDSSERCFEPDLMVMLDENTALTETGIIGPCNICIEVVYNETIALDHEYKLMEYESGGVTEYWIIDPTHNECRFHRLNAQQKYEAVSEDQNVIYTTPQLPRLQLHVPTLWCEELPSILEAVESVRAMLNNKDQ